MGRLEVLDFSNDQTMEWIKDAMYNLLKDYYARTDLTELYTFAQRKSATMLFLLNSKCNLVFEHLGTHP